jgi:SpoVK/Ycf46/Vps4 family AAA+-type ATPase
MSTTFAPKDTVFMYGPPSYGKTFLMQALLGEYRKPVICVDPGFGEWHDPASRSFLEASELEEYLLSCAREEVFPDPILSVADTAAEETFRMLWEWEVGCTVIVDEIDTHAPNQGKTNEHLRLMLKKGRHIQGKDSDASISVVGACHAAQEVDRSVARFGAHVCFQQEEKNARDRAEQYLHPDVNVRELEKYEFVVSKKVENLTFPLGEYGPEIWRYFPDEHKIDSVGSFPRTADSHA